MVLKGLSTLILIIGSIAIAKGITIYLLCGKKFSKRLTITLTIGVPVVTFAVMYFVLGLILRP